ncbi:hypothetical protein B9Z19DRAFT_1076464 [Tuber borchii]|uniref:Uncharacterized protein n=1 Tax=Tuber borchii TaxID=42251 RepID=A0A2T7A1U5_TUBBO|nr:hypothetical protein B9Z19DRAFT_1076464 [Tuber borchii]
MVVALVYNEFDGCSDTRKDLSIAKQNSTQAIRSMVPVQIGTSGHVETAYANPDRGSFLKSVREMERNMEKMMARQEVMERELTVLRPIKATAIGIRDRFFASFLESKASAIGNLAVIEEVNKLAHEGDVVTDVCLLKNGMIRYPGTFRRLYGLHWEDASSLLVFPHMVTAMNLRATWIANGGEEGCMQAEFNELQCWSRHATPDQIAIFNADPSGRTHHKLIYLHLKNKLRLTKELRLKLTKELHRRR